MRGSDMDTRFLEEYVLFSHNMNYAKTAEELFVSQPTLRSHMHALENEIGARLIQKRGSKLSLTPAGRLFLKHAKAIAEQTEDAIEECRALAGNSTSISIGTLDYPPFEHIVLNARAHLAACNPPYHVDITFASGAYANIESVITGGVDLAVFCRLREAGQSQPERIDLPESIESIPIATSECLFWMNPQCPLYNKDRIIMSDVDGYTLCLGNSSNMIAAGHAIESYFSQRGLSITRDNQPCLNYRDLFFSSDEKTFGITLAEARHERKESMGIRIFSFADMTVPCDVYALYNAEGLDSCGLKFVQACRHIAADEAD